MIIDSHLHLWDLDEFDLPWVTGFEALNKTFSLDMYQSDFKSVDHAIYVEVDVAENQKGKEIESIGLLCRDPHTPLVAMVASLDVTRSDIAAYLQRINDEAKHVVGFRQVLHTEERPQGYCLQESFIKGVQVIGHAGFSFDICIRPQELNDAVALIKQCPETHFVIDHGGIPAIASYVEDKKAYEKWKEEIAAIAAMPNSVCKISGLVTQAGDLSQSEALLGEVLAWLKASFGAERLLFGSDWPVVALVESAQQWQQRLSAMVSNWSEEERQHLFYKTAQRAYLSRLR
ncbi:amidohydrolase family protein [Vibrio sp. S9_S30]|uniref:amidohydrolase family protein n=1 Tax=Vibrio sp. S9_S30 TaxID=2720226 RepID=UPI001680C4BE|nr:amidohydrolase family protein [Vibrio sp. S9_S30]MBD1556624.1 amidohydrolase family protein [Vibrio sp. S9_S30]